MLYKIMINPELMVFNIVLQNNEMLCTEIHKNVYKPLNRMSKDMYAPYMSWYA